MKITKSQLVQIIKEEIEAARSEGGPINDPAFLQGEITLDGKTMLQRAQAWLDSLIDPAKEAADSGGDDSAAAQRFLSKVEGITAEDLVGALMDNALGARSPRPATKASTTRHLGGSFAKDGYQQE